MYSHMHHIDKKSVAIAKYVTLIFMLGLAIAGVNSTRGLYADGAYFLLEILRTEKFFDFDKTRLFAQIITQAPVILAINSGINDVNLLIRIHSFGLIAIPIGFWIATLLVHIRTNYFWLFLLSFSVTYLNSGFFSVGEYNLCYSVTAFCAALLIKDGKLGVADSSALLLSAFALTRLYESMVFLGPMLYVISMCRLFFTREQGQDSNTAQCAIVLSAFFFAVGSAIAAWSILFPRSPENLSGATNIKLIFSNVQVMYTFAVIILFLIFFSMKRVFVRYVFSATLLLSIGFLLYSPGWATPSMHYESRTIVGLGLFCTITLSAAIFFNRQLCATAALYRQIIWVMPFTLFISLAIPLLFHTSGFLNWVRIFELEVTSHTGLVPSENTKMYQSVRLNTYAWPWTNPSLSILLKTRTTDSIIMNSYSYKGWQPFDPEKQTPHLPQEFQRVCCL